MKYCPRCEQTFGDEALVCPVDRSMLRTRDRPEDSLIGRVIRARYHVISKLGQGGMGAVYLAEQVSVSRKVALKVLRQEFSRDDDFVRRFHQEAQLAASLNNPRVATIFDFDQTDDGNFVIVMEYLEGRVLSEVIREEGALDVRRAVRLAIEIAEGLHAAHRAGIVHRDVKPQNIMLVGSNEDVKLMDFGIARLRDAAPRDLTGRGVVVGTPAYMAPEQIEGAEVTERTDIYAFGVVLYEMLTGRVPFSGSTATALLTKQLREAAVPVRQLRSEVPSAVEQVIARALEKDPRARQSDMGEVVRGLRQVDGRPADGPASDTFVASQTQLTSSSGPGTPSTPPTLIASARTTVSPDAAPQASPQPKRIARPWKLLGVAGLAMLVVASTAWWLVLSGRWSLREEPGGSSAVVPPPKVPDVMTPPAAPKPETPGPPVLEPPIVRVPPVPPPVSPPGNEPDPTPPRPKPPAKPPPPDPGRIRALMQEKLRANGLLKTAPDQPGVSVQVSDDRIVTLSGILSDQAQLERTVQLAKEVPGVRDVRTRINLKENWEQPQKE